MVTTGSLYTFSAFSENLRQTLGYSGTEINAISAAGNAALYLAFLFAGPMYDELGSKVTMFFGFATYSIGYLLMYLTFIGSIKGTSQLMSVYYFLAGCGSSTCYLVATAVNLVNFTSPTTRGVILGVLLLFYGLSGTIYAQIFNNIYSTRDRVDTSGFLLFLTLSVAIVNALAVFSVRKIPLMTIPMKTSDSNQEIEKTVAIEEPAAKPAKLVQVIWQLLKSQIFWMYTMVLVWQQGITYMNNIPLMVIAIAPEKANDAAFVASQSSIHVTILSIFQSISRFTFGFISQKSSKISIFLDNTFLLFLIQLILIIPPLLMSIVPMSLDLLFFCSVLVGFGWGAHGGLFPGLIKDYFGMEKYGTASGLVMALVPVGIIACNTIFGSLYDTARGADAICTRDACYKDSMLISIGLQAFTAACAFFLFSKNRKNTK